MNDTVEKMLSGEMGDRAIAEAIISLRAQGETASDICGYVEVINRNAKPISPEGELLDVCGTGGSGLNRFNVSTACAFVLSALGVKVIKHGNRGSQRPNGSFDLLEGLGVDIEQEPSQIEQTISQTNLGFVFARHYHPRLKMVAEARELAGGRSIFNLAGPLSNPAKITFQVIGTADIEKAVILAEACIKLGRRRAAVVHGDPGIDEVSISGATQVYECVDKKIKRYQIVPGDFGIPIVPYEKIPGGDFHVNREIFMRLLKGDVERSIIDMVSINAGLALYIAGKELSIENGYLSAKNCILSGKMNRQFEAYLSSLGSTKRVTSQAVDAKKLRSFQALRFSAQLIAALAR